MLNVQKLKVGDVVYGKTVWHDCIVYVTGIIVGVGSSMVRVSPSNDVIFPERFLTPEEEMIWRLEN